MSQADQVPLDDRTAFDAAVAFGLGVPIIEPTVVARGELGRVWRIETVQGRFALKEPLAHVMTAPDSEVEANVVLQEHMLDNGVAMPRPIRAPDGRGAVGRWRAYEWVDLAPFEGPFELLGAAMARMHAAGPATDKPTDRWFTDVVSGPDWDVINDQATVGAVLWAPLVRAITPELQALNELIRSSRNEPSRICHLDVCTDNIAEAPSTPLVIFDWENAGPASPRQDLCSTIADLREVDRDPQPLFDGYRRAGGDDRALQPGDFALALAHQAHMIELSCRRALDHPQIGDEIGDRARWRLARALFRPLTRAAVDRLVEEIS